MFDYKFTNISFKQTTCILLLNPQLNTPPARCYFKSNVSFEIAAGGNVLESQYQLCMFVGLARAGSCCKRGEIPRDTGSSQGRSTRRVVGLAPISYLGIYVYICIYIYIYRERDVCRS